MFGVGKIIDQSFLTNLLIIWSKCSKTVILYYYNLRQQMNKTVFIYNIYKQLNIPDINCIII